MNKSPKSHKGEVLSTVIDIRQDEPYTIISREIDGDHTNTTDSKAIELVLEVVNDETTKPGSLKKEMKLIENALDEATDSLEKESGKTNLVSDTLEELLVLIYDEVIPRLPEDKTDKPAEEDNEVVE